MFCAQNERVRITGLRGRVTVTMAATGHGDEALKIAQNNRSLLPASYNLAAIYAQTGHRREALALLQRHFFRYERY